MTPNWSASPIGWRIAATVQPAPDSTCVGHHLGEVHPVDVVGAHHDDDVGLLVGEQVERLVDRVGAAEVPPLADALLRRHRGDVVAQQVGHPPGRRHVPVEAVRLVLRQHDDLEVAGVDDVGEREVDEAVDPAERHGGLGTVGGQRHQSLALTAGQDDGEDLLAGGCGTHATETSGAQTARSTHSARVSSRLMRIDVLSKEYPPEVYGGAGRPRRRAGPRPARPARRRRAGALLRRPARRGRDDGVRRAGLPRRRQRRDPHPGRRPGDGRRLRRGRPRALAHVVRQHGRPPRRPHARHPARRQRPLAGADAAVEGRAARRRLRALELGGADGVRGRGRHHRGQRGDARRRAAQLSRRRPGPRPRRAQRHRHRPTGPRSTTPTGCASSASTPTVPA